MRSEMDFFFFILHSSADGVRAFCQNIFSRLDPRSCLLPPISFLYGGCMIWPQGSSLDVIKKKSAEMHDLLHIGFKLLFFSFGGAQQYQKSSREGWFSLFPSSLSFSLCLAHPVLETVSVEAFWEIMGNDGQIYETIGILLQTAH